MPPLKQFESGVSLYDIKCDHNLIPVMTYYQQSPLCVRYGHIEELQSRGLGLQLLVNHNSKSTILSIEGLNDSYAVDQKIPFTIRFNGNFPYCNDYPRVFVTEPDGKIVWSGKELDLSCYPSITPTYMNMTWQSGQLGDLRLHDYATIYTMVAIFGDQVTTKQFWLEPKVSSVVIPDGFGKNKTFVPSSISVQVGINSTVRWINQDSIVHTIEDNIADNSDFYFTTRFDFPPVPVYHSNTIKPGDYFQFNFQDPGIYTYSVGTGPHGTVTVVRPTGTITELQINTHLQGRPHSYSNDRISVYKGDMVSWQNIDNAPHTITSVNGTFDSGPILPMERFLLDTSSLAPGYYDYFDKLNASNTGGIRVIDPTQEQDKEIINATKDLYDVKLFLSKYPEAYVHVNHGYYDQVEYEVAKLVYPHRDWDGIRTLELDIALSPDESVRDVTVTCGGPISGTTSDVVNYLNSGDCFNPR